MDRSRRASRGGCRTTWFVSVVCLVFVLAGPQPVFAEMDEEYPLSWVAREVPTFGGMYVDRPTLYVWLTDDGQSLAAAFDAIRSVWPSDKFEDYTPVALRAKYSFLQLMAWHDQMVAVYSIDGIISTDIDDQNNRLTVGVEDLASQRENVEAALKKDGVPLVAVDIVQEELFVQLLPSPPTSPSTAPRPSPPSRAAGRHTSGGSSLWLLPALAWAAIALVSVLVIRSRRRSRQATR